MKSISTTKIFLFLAFYCTMINPTFSQNTWKMLTNTGSEIYITTSGLDVRLFFRKNLDEWYLVFGKTQNFSGLKIYSLKIRKRDNPDIQINLNSLKETSTAYLIKVPHSTIPALQKGDDIEVSTSKGKHSVPLTGTALAVSKIYKNIGQAREDIAGLYDDDEETIRNSKASDTNDNKMYAALATSRNGKSYGWSFNFESGLDSRLKAKSECEKNSDGDCAVKLVLRGPACIAYSHNPQSGGAYGWALNKQPSAAISRAKSECTKRNGNASCQNHVWSCNTKDGEYSNEIKLVFEAINNSKSTPKDNDDPNATGQCIMQFVYLCRTNDKNLFSSVNSMGRNFISFPGCGEEDAKSLFYNIESQSWFKHYFGQTQGKNIPRHVSDSLVDDTNRFFNEATKIIPNCSPQLTASTTEKNIRKYLQIAFFKQGPQFENAVKRKDEGFAKQTAKSQHYFLPFKVK